MDHFMVKLINLVFTGFYLILIFIHTVSAENVQAFFDIHSNTRLASGTIISSTQVPTTTVCAAKCIANERCEAFNVEKESIGTNQQCDLLALVPADHAFLDYANNAWIFGIADLCAFVSCTNQAVCSPSTLDAVPICFGGCPGGHSGTNCDIECGVMLEGSCYWIEEILLNNTEARINCEAYGARLAEVVSASINNQLKAISSGFVATWIGGSRQQGDWVWAESGRSLTFYDWVTSSVPSEPTDSPGEDCMHIWDDHNGWADIYCSTEMYSICEYVYE